MNARSVGSASHADAVDADMPSATGSGERDVWSSSSSSRVRGRSRTPVRRGSGAPETFRVTNSVFFLPRCKKTHTCSGQSQAVPERSIRRDESSQKCREERKKATTTTASARAECEARVGCRTRGGPAASSRVAGEGAPRESGGEPDRRDGGAVSRARSADFSNARRCRLAARDDRQRLLRCVRGGDAPERRRIHVGRARGCRGQPSVSGATSPPNATGRPSVLAPAGRVPSAKTLSGRIWHAPSRRSTAFVSSFIFSHSPRRAWNSNLSARLPSPFPIDSDAGHRRGHVQRYHPRLGRREGEGEVPGAARRAAGLRGAARRSVPRGGRGGGEAAAGC